MEEKEVDDSDSSDEYYEQDPMADASHLGQIYTEALFIRAFPKRMKKTCKITGYHAEHSIYSRDDYIYI